MEIVGCGRLALPRRLLVRFSHDDSGMSPCLSCGGVEAGAGSLSGDPLNEVLHFDQSTFFSILFEEIVSFIYFSRALRSRPRTSRN